MHSAAKMWKARPAFLGLPSARALLGPGSEPNIPGRYGGVDLRYGSISPSPRGFNLVADYVDTNSNSGP